MRSIKWSLEYEPLMKQMCEQAHPITKHTIFGTHWEFLCFAAVVGWHFKLKSKISGETKEIPSRIYENKDRAIDLMYLLAISEKQDGDVLREENENSVVEVFEVYAHGGLKTIKGWLKETASDLHGDKAIIVALSNNNFLELDNALPISEADIQF